MNEHIRTINKPKNAKKIPVTVYEQLPIIFGAPMWIDFIDGINSELKWVDGVPYKVTVV